MPTWNPNRDPGMYPARWHSIACAQPGEYYFDTAADQAEAKRIRNKWNAFKACLRGHPLHPSAQAEAKRRYRIRAEETPQGVTLWLKIEWAGELAGQILTQLYQD